MLHNVTLVTPGSAVHVYGAYIEMTINLGGTSSYGSGQRAEVPGMLIITRNSILARDQKEQVATT